jgi:hypothetical protein
MCNDSECLCYDTPKPCEECARLQAEVERLRKLMVHCDRCGGDYAQTGVETGCPCVLRAELAEVKGLPSPAVQAGVEALFLNLTLQVHSYGHDDVGYYVLLRVDRGWWDSYQHARRGPLPCETHGVQGCQTCSKRS